MRHNYLHHLLVWDMLLTLIACDAQPTVGLPPTPNNPTVSVQTQTQALAPATACARAFVTHALEHVTETHGPAVRMFETNGTGVAVNDLNADGRLDIVLANFKGPSTILWNLGGLQFEKETLADYKTRAVSMVDVDGDGHLDIVFTHVAESLSWWRNVPAADVAARPTFVRTGLPGVLKPAHSMAWGDVDADGDLDLVTGSYDAELHLQPGSTFLFSGGAGVYYYARQGAEFVAERLIDHSEALTSAIFDFDADGDQDILIGNDFDTPDYAWAKTPKGWQAVRPFPLTAQHPMSFDVGDINNDGWPEIFATDMKPYDVSVETMVEWLPMMATMRQVRPSGQTAENVLLTRTASGTYSEVAAPRGINASGWSWSGKFGDLDQDGFLDLYVVNGMIDAELFHYLSNHELVEENQVFRNLGDGSFLPAPDWGLGSTASGRGLSLADLDNDGDLDAVVNNLNSPAQLLENQLCQNTNLQVAVRWPQSLNTHALGAKLTLYTSVGIYHREVRANSGYLSSDPARIHFGVPADAQLLALTIHWPDNMFTQLTDLQTQSLLTVTR